MCLSFEVFCVVDLFSSVGILRKWPDQSITKILQIRLEVVTDTEMEETLKKTSDDLRSTKKKDNRWLHIQRAMLHGYLNTSTVQMPNYNYN